jgi:hypothetical protein
MAAARIPITNLYGGGDYTGQILIGSARTPANVILDTGSSTLAVKQTVYSGAGDTSLVATGYVQDITYGTGGWAGPVINTSLAFGPTTLQSGSVALADEEQPNNFGAADGIFGLAYTPLNDAYNLTAYLTQKGVKPPVTYPWPFPVRNTQSAIEQFQKFLNAYQPSPITPLFSQLVQAGVVPNMFAFYTRRSTVNALSQTDPSNQGFFILGGGPEQTDLFSGTFVSASVVDDAYYNTNLVSVQVGSAAPVAAQPLAAQFISTSISNAIIDSGTNSLALSTDVYNAIISALTTLNPNFASLANAGSSNGVPNTEVNLAQWPNITFNLTSPGGGVAALTCTPATYWQFDSFQAGTASFQINNMGQIQSILGLPLMNNYYTVFDRSDGTNGVVSFAPLS